MKLSSINTTLVFITLIMGVFTVLSFKSCEAYQADLALSKLALEQYKNENQSFKLRIKEDSTKIVSQELMIIQKTKESQRLLKEKSDLEEVNQQLKIKYTNEVKDMVIEYRTDSVFIYDTLYREVGVVLGTEFAQNNEWYSIRGSIQRQGVEFDLIQFDNDLTISLGLERGGWFKKPIPTLEIQNKNPYVMYNSVSNIKLEDKDKLINKPWFTFLIGLGGGVIIGTVITVH